MLTFFGHSMNFICFLLFSPRVAFPEVNIGILPAATGSQRLPRVTDLASAVEMCTTGMPVSAKKALEKGIVDKVCIPGCCFFFIAVFYNVYSKKVKFIACQILLDGIHRLAEGNHNIGRQGNSCEAGGLENCITTG